MARENDPASKAQDLEAEIWLKLKSFGVDIDPVWSLILEHGYHKWSAGYDSGLEDAQEQ